MPAIAKEIQSQISHCKQVAERFAKEVPKIDDNDYRKEMNKIIGVFSHEYLEWITNPNPIVPGGARSPGYLIKIIFHEIFANELEQIVPKSYTSDELMTMLENTNVSFSLKFGFFERSPI